MTTNENTTLNYSSSHPWYYVLGGKIPSIKDIWNDVLTSEYKGYKAEEISNASGNNAKLRSLKKQTLASLKRDVSQYRKYVFELHQYRKSLPKDHEPVYEGIHMSVSLKYSHIYNNLAHLSCINDHLAMQPELFDLLEV